MMKKRRIIKIALISMVFLAVLLTVACGSNAPVTIDDNAIPLSASDSASFTGPTKTTAVSTKTDVSTEAFSVLPSEASGGSIAVCTNVDTMARLKLKVAKDGEAVYYDIKNVDMLSVPMQMGNGTYTVSLFKNLGGKDYEQIYTASVNIKMQDAEEIFLGSSTIVDFENCEMIDDLAKDLCASGSDIKTVKNVHDYVVDKIEYDYDKYETLSFDYIPDVEKVLEEENGICVDYATLTAALLREIGIPTKLVMGYRTDASVYHAWNEVLVDGDWVVIDTTRDSVLESKKQSESMIKDAVMYSAEKIF